MSLPGRLLLEVTTMSTPRPGVDRLHPGHFLGSIFSDQAFPSKTDSMNVGNTTIHAIHMCQ
jgi:hypothetical protein